MAGGRLFSFAKAGIAYSEEGNISVLPPAIKATPPGDEFQTAEIHWDVLGDVTYRKKWNKEMQLDFMYPVFGEKVKKLQGKDLYITGFMIPLDVKDGFYAISLNPYASCFFCGGSGPESVISLKFKRKPRRYETDEYITIRGTMALNDTNVNDFIYIFKNAEEYNP